jgi:hypothetical protein
MELLQFFWPQLLVQLFFQQVFVSKLKLKQQVWKLAQQLVQRQLVLEL